MIGLDATGLMIGRSSSCLLTSTALDPFTWYGRRHPAIGQDGGNELVLTKVHEVHVRMYLLTRHASWQQLFMDSKTARLLGWY